MLTSDKAICEMNTGELAEEYEYCMKSAESEALAPDLPNVAVKPLALAMGI